MPRLSSTTNIFACAVLAAGTLRAAQVDSAIQNVEALIKAGKYEAAKPVLESYVATNPKSWQAFYQLGYVDFRLHRIQESLSMLCKSLLIDATFADSHKVLAYDLNILGRPDLAQRELELAIKYDPAGSESHYELGRIEYEQGSYLKSVQQLEKAKSLSPEFVRVYHNLGLAYSALGENGKAVTNFEEALRLNKLQANPSAWPLIDYATYCNMQNDFARARDLLLQAIDVDKSSDQAYGELAKAYRGLGQNEDAIAMFKRAIALNPKKPDYHYVLARLYTQTHQVEEAKQELAAYEQQKQSASK